MNIAKRLARKLPATDRARPAQIYFQRRAQERLRQVRLTDMFCGTPARQEKLDA